LLFVQVALPGQTVLPLNRAVSPHQAPLPKFEERHQDAVVDQPRHRNAGGDRRQAPRHEDVFAFGATDLECDSVQNFPLRQIVGNEPICKNANQDAQLIFHKNWRSTLTQHHS